MESELVVKNYKELRLEYFKGELAKAKKRLDRHVSKMADGRLNGYDYAVQDKASELGAIVSYLEDAVNFAESDCESDEDLDAEHCYECTGLGDDYRMEDGELVSNCYDCPYNKTNYDD